MRLTVLCKRGYLDIYRNVSSYICICTVHICACVCLCTRMEKWYGVATVSRIDKMIGLFCKRDL